MKKKQCMKDRSKVQFLKTQLKTIAFTKTTVLASAILFMIGSSHPCQAAEGTQRIALVDMQKALQTVDAGKKAKAKLEEEFNAKRTSFQKEEASIKKMNEDFQKNSLVLNEAARTKKQNELQNRILKFQQATQQSQEEIQNKQRTLTEPIVVKLRSIVGEIARKKNYNLVLEKNENLVLYSEDKDDLTSEAISTFDKNEKSGG